MKVVTITSKSDAKFPVEENSILKYLAHDYRFDYDTHYYVFELIGEPVEGSPPAPVVFK